MRVSTVKHTQDKELTQDTMSISVAMTTYNGDKFVLSQLESIAQQTKLPIELVVCDDGSTDNTMTILRKFATVAPFQVHIYHNVGKLGFRANFVQCAQRCTGDLVAFCDQDDIWLDNKLEVQQEDFRNPDIMLSCHNADLINRMGSLIDRRLDQYNKSCQLDLNSAGPTLFPRGFTQVVRKKLVKWEWLRQISIDIGDPSELMSHDGWFFFLALLHGTAAYHQECLVKYRQHGDNASGAVPSKRSMFLARFASRPNDFNRLAMVWSNRCDMLRALLTNEPDLAEIVETRARHLLKRYQHASAAAAARSQFYAAPSRAAKIKLLSQAVFRGDFKANDPWFFPMEAILKDSAFILRDSLME